MTCDGLLRFAALLAATLLPVACVYDYDTSCPDGEERTELVLNTGIADAATRADLSLSDNEKMSSLRIVILHEDGTVEHNKVATLSAATEHHDVFLVTKGETKKIYLIANESSIDGLPATLAGFATGASGFAATVEDMPFTADYANAPIPMSACYEVAVDTLLGRTKQMYVVRTATKFSFDFVNYRKSPVTVKDLSVGNVVTAGPTWLMPQFIDGEGSSIASEKCFVSKADDEVLVSLSGDSSNGEFWIDWLKKVVDNSNADPTNTELADKDGWLAGYAVPDGAKHTTYTYGSTITVPAYADGAPGKDSTWFYLCESKSLADATDLDGEQSYSVAMTLTDETTGETLEYSAALPNLRALFRNTHVVVTASLYGSTVTLKYVVEPWWATDNCTITFD